MVGPFFVAGTGRCGTSQLTRVLGDHPQVHALVSESRFLVDPGGFEDLVRTLTTSYTPYHADDALRRLDWLLNQRLTGQTYEAFRGWDLPGEFGPSRYRAACARLWDQLIWYEFDEGVPPLSHADGRWHHAPGEPRSLRRVVARYFPDRAKLVGIVREFTDELFSAVAREAGKPTWCEKTPLNLLAIPFLLEVFPEAAVVAIARHPYQVVASHLDQFWAPSDVDQAVNWVESIYRRWLAQRKELLRDARYVEVRAEDLAADWPGRRAALFDRLGLPDAETASTFAPSKLDHRTDQLDAAQRSQVAARLGWVAEALGYQP